MKKNIGSMILGIIFILVIAALAFMLFINAGVGFPGWFLMIILVAFFGFLIYRMHTKGLMTMGIISLGLLVLILVIFILTGGLGGSKSSIVSDGVDKSDLGNIMSGQYYFDDGNTVYYSNFDDNFKAHIKDICISAGTPATA